MLIRNVTIAVAVGAAVALQQRDLKLMPLVACLALWFSLGGHLVEVTFLNVLRARLPRRRAVQVFARLVVWLVGGAVLYLCMAATAQVLAVRGLPPRLCWLGGVAFTSVELVIHAVLAGRGRPSLYDGRG